MILFQIGTSRRFLVFQDRPPKYPVCVRRGRKTKNNNFGKTGMGTKEIKGNPGEPSEMVANVNKDPLDFFFKVPLGFSVRSSCKDAWLINSSVGTHPKDRHQRACPENNPQEEYEKEQGI